MRRLTMLATVAVAGVGTAALVASGNADPDDFRAADRVCAPSLVRDAIEDVNEAEVLEIAVQASAVPSGWTDGAMPGARSDVRPVADAALGLLEGFEQVDGPPTDVGRLDHHRRVLASACADYRR